MSMLCGTPSGPTSTRNITVPSSLAAPRCAGKARFSPTCSPVRSVRSRSGRPAGRPDPDRSRRVRLRCHGLGHDRIGAHRLRFRRNDRAHRRHLGLERFDLPQHRRRRGRRRFLAPSAMGMTGASLTIWTDDEAGGASMAESGQAVQCQRGADRGAAFPLNRASGRMCSWCFPCIGGLRRGLERRHLRGRG